MATRKFIASLSYELSADTSEDARKLLRAELVGRRWRDRERERRMPRQALFCIRNVTDDKQTTDTLHALCATELRQAAAAVAAAGLPIKVLRAFIHVAGAGTYGLTPEGFFD
jgi:hypothetical protein